MKRVDNSTGSEYKVVHKATGPNFSGFNFLLTKLTPGNYSLIYRALNYIGPGENSTEVIVDPMGWILDVVAPL